MFIIPTYSDPQENKENDIENKTENNQQSSGSESTNGNDYLQSIRHNFLHQTSSF